MQVRKDTVPAEKHAEIEEVAAALGVKAVLCGEQYPDDEWASWEGWDGQHPLITNGVSEGYVFADKHAALLCALRLIKELIP